MTTALCLHELVEQTCEHMRDAIAIVDKETSISFAVLNNTANRLARALQRRSVTSETFVGIYFDRSINFVITVLAILKAGGAYIPLEPSLPSERLREIIDESQLSLVVAPAPLTQSIAGDVSCFALHDWFTSPGIEDETNLEQIALPDHLAYVIFTSGSTGVPKGVMGTHRGICNRLLWGKVAYQLEKQDILLHQTPVSFDPSIWEIFGGLISGARIVISRPDGHKDPGYITQTIVRYAVTIVDFVPALLRPFVQHSASVDCQSLRCITCAGEALTEDLQYLVFQRFPQISLFHLYGPTEASIDVTFWKCQIQYLEGPIPLGHPIQGMYIVLLDEHCRSVDQGQIGEICLGGIGLARGYIHRPDLTAERFIPDTTGSASGARLYRTGDYGKFLHNGQLVGQPAISLP